MSIEPVGAATGNKILISAQLSSRRVAWVDVVVAHRRLGGDWVSRTDVIQECLDRFFEHGGITATNTRPHREPSVRKRYRMHLRYETVQAINADLVAPSVVSEVLSPWHIVATALLDHLADVDVGPPSGPRFA